MLKLKTIIFLCFLWSTLVFSQTANPLPYNILHERLSSLHFLNPESPVFHELLQWSQGHRHPQKPHTSHLYWNSSEYAYNDDYVFPTQDKLCYFQESDDKVNIEVHLQFTYYSNVDNNFSPLTASLRKKLLDVIHTLELDLNDEAYFLGLEFNLIGSLFDPKKQTIEFFTQHKPHLPCQQDDCAYNILILDNDDPFWLTHDHIFSSGLPREFAYFKGIDLSEKYNEGRFLPLKKKFSSVLSRSFDQGTFNHEFNHYVLLNIDAYKEQGNTNTYDYKSLSKFNAYSSHNIITALEIAIAWWRLGNDLPLFNDKTKKNLKQSLSHQTLYPLHELILKNDISGINHFISTYPNQLNFYLNQYQGNLKPLHLAVLETKKHHDFRILNKLLSLEIVDINIKTKYKKATALHLAAFETDTLGVDLLFFNGANINVKTNDGRTPLHMSHSLRNQVFTEDDHALIKAMRLLILHGAQIEAKDTDGLTPLHYAVNNGDILPHLQEESETWNVSMAKKLIAYGAKINEQDDNGNTPLHSCTATMRIGVARFLLEHGADPSILNQKGETAQQMLKRIKVDIFEPNQLFVPNGFIELLAP